VLPKPIVAGETVTGVTLVPERLTNCGAIEALSLIVISPGMLPTVGGLKVTTILQPWLGGTVPKQVLISA
jgi:hypothetical protein